MSDYFIERTQCSHHEIFPGVHIHATGGQKLMLSYVEMEPGAEVKPHSHPHEQMGMLLEGELEFTIADERRVVQPGEMWRIPGGVVHSAVAGRQRVRAIDVFCPVREEYL